MNPILKFKKLHPDAVAPAKAHPADAGFDLVAISADYLPPNYKVVVYKTGLAVQIPDGHVGLLMMRSSVRNAGLILVGGVIDAGYTGEISVQFQALGNGQRVYSVGDKVAQLVVLPLPQFELVEASELDASPRGAKGFGSTGR